MAMALLLTAALAVHAALMGPVSAAFTAVTEVPCTDPACRASPVAKDEREDGEDVHVLSLLHVKAAVVKRQMQPVSLHQEVQEAQDMMQTNPTQGCMKVMQLLQSHREPFLTTHFGAKLTRLDLLRAGIGEAAALGLLRSLESEVLHSNPIPAGSVCWGAITALGVQYDHERSLALYENSPHLWDAVVAWNRRVMHSHELLRTAVMMFAGVYGVPPSDQALYDMDRAGGFDVMFDVLRNNFTDYVVAQAAWAGLSDNVENTRVGAQLAADHGGPSVGVQSLVRVMRHYHGKHGYQPGMRFGLRYESIHDVNGILMHDDLQGTWTKAATEAGFLEEAVLAMREEPQDLLTTENGCEAVALTATGNATNQVVLKGLGAVELMVEAIDRFRDVQDSFYYHLHSCGAGLLPFALSSTEDQDAMLRLGLLEALEASMPKWANASPRRDPWGRHFPWSKVEELRAILRARRGH